MVVLKNTGFVIVVVCVQSTLFKIIKGFKIVKGSGAVVPVVYCSRGAASAAANVRQVLRHFRHVEQIHQLGQLKRLQEIRVAISLVAVLDDVGSERVLLDLRQLLVIELIVGWVDVHRSTNLRIFVWKNLRWTSRLQILEILVRSWYYLGSILVGRSPRGDRSAELAGGASAARLTEESRAVTEESVYVVAS